MSSQPLVSIVMATRNRPELMARALASIREQTLQDFEVLVTDDGSALDALEGNRAVFAALDGRFQFQAPLAPGTSGSGPAIAKNRGLARAGGRFIAFLDDDDCWVWPRYLETAVTALEAKGLDLYFADMRGYRGDTLVWDTFRLDKASLVIGPRVMEVDAETYLVDRAAFFRTIGQRNVHPNTVVIRKSLADKGGPFLRSQFFGEDYEFILRQADRIEWALFGPQVAARYRLPEGDSTSLTNSALESHLQMISAAQHLRVAVRSQEAQDAARRFESWHFRQAGAELRRQGQNSTARAFAWRALAARFSLGNLANLVRISLP